MCTSHILHYMVVLIQVSTLQVSSHDSSPQAGKYCRQWDNNDTLSSSKKNSDYLPKEPKPIYLALKNNFNKMMEWEAYKCFTDNCTSKGNVPRSLKWTPTILWAFSNPELNTQYTMVKGCGWSSIIAILVNLAL